MIKTACRAAAATAVLTATLLPQPAQAAYLAPGHCFVTASAVQRAGAFVVGWGENICAAPASVAITEAGIEYKKCTWIFCHWTEPENVHHPVISRPGLDTEYIAAGIPWKGRHTYRLFVIGSCFNCRVSQGGIYGPEVKLR